MKRARLIVASVVASVSLLAIGRPVLAAADDAEPGSDKLFKELDANGDGKLAESEIPKAHRKFFERLLRIGDSDKNGILTREEFDRALQKKEESVTDINKTGDLGLGQGPRGKANFNPKQIFQALDKNKDGKLTRDEASKRPRVVALFDRLGKDEITLDDLTAATKNMGARKGKKGKKGIQAAKTTSESSAEKMPGGPGGHMAPAFFKLLDANHDGLLSKAELAKAGELFDQLDKNQDGYLEPRELMGPPPGGASANAASPAVEPLAANGLPEAKKARTTNFRGGSRIVQMIKDADADGDGKLSRKEAPKQFKKNFAAIDTNGDEYLEQSEIQAWIRSRHKKKAASPESQKPADETTKKTSGL